MKIVQISTSDIDGGAAIAAYRLHKSLRQQGLDSRMLVRQKVLNDDSVLCINSTNSKSENSRQWLVLNASIQEQYINAHLTDLNTTIFSLPYPGFNLANLHTVREADIINLHWVAYYQSPVTLQHLFKLGIPVVWTLHDQWAFTGGCHYSAGCNKYCTDCSECPQLSDNPFNITKALLGDKLELFKKANLTIVTPSRWLATCAEESKLFRNLRVEVIPYSLETDIFKPIDKKEAKKKLDIPEDNILLLFGAQDAREKRKGFRELVNAMRYCRSNAKFQELVMKNDVQVLCFGHPSEDLETIGLPVISLGYLSSNEKISEVYSAADIFILPSLEDNLPNTILESLSCGTPVVAFSVGGVPDIVESGVSGLLAPVCNVDKLGEAILSLIFKPDQREIIGKKGRQKILDGYSLEIQGKNYLSLYEELCANVSHKNQPELAATQTRFAAVTEDLFVNTETTIGPLFETIYDQVLLKSLKDYTPILHQKWQDSEADRKARLEVIKKQTTEFKEKLDACEADRAARLDVINNQGDAIGQLKGKIQQLELAYFTLLKKFNM